MTDRTVAVYPDAYWRLLLVVDYLNVACAKEALGHVGSWEASPCRDDIVTADALKKGLSPYASLFFSGLGFEIGDWFEGLRAKVLELVRAKSDAAATMRSDERDSAHGEATNGKGANEAHRHLRLRLALPAIWSRGRDCALLCQPRIPSHVDEVTRPGEAKEPANEAKPPANGAQVEPRKGESPPPDSWVCLDEWNPFAVLASNISPLSDPARRWVDHDIQHWFRHTISGEKQDGPRPLTPWTHEEIIRPLSDVCREINRLYYDVAHPTSGRVQGSPIKYVRATELIRIIEACLGEEPGNGKARLLLLTLLWIRVAESARVAQKGPGEESERLEPALTLVRPLDPTYVRNSMHGAMSGIRGLRFIFRGGIMPEPDHGRVTVVRGRPGAGKTALALTADMAARGRTAVYVSLEQPYEWLERQLSKLGLRNDDRFTIARFEHMRTQEKTKGVLVIAGRASTLQSDPDVNLIDRLDEVIDVLDSLGALRPGTPRPWYAVAIDSVNRFRFGPPEESVMPLDEWYRAQLYRLVQRIEGANLWGIFVTEAIKRDARFGTLEYEASTVIDLATDALHNRTLQIQKSRTQPYREGVHAFRIEDERGVSVVPSLASMLSDVASLRRPDMSSQWCLDTGGLRGPAGERAAYPWRSAPRGLGRPDGPEPASLRRTDPPTIPVRSSLFLYSLERKGALRLALHLAICQRQRMPDAYPQRCQEPPEEKSEDDSEDKSDPKEYPRNVVIVSFQRHPDRIEQLLKEEPFATALEGRITEHWLRWFPPDGQLTAAEVVSEVASWFRIARDRGIPIDRLVFEGVDSLEEFLPVVAADSGFFPALHEVVVAHRVTSIFVASKPVQSHAVEPGDTGVEALVDLVDFAILADLPGEDRDAEASTDVRYLELRKSPYWERTEVR